METKIELDVENLKKDTATSVRLSRVVKDELALRGLSVQSVFDKAIKELFTVKAAITSKDHSTDKNS